MMDVTGWRTGFQSVAGLGIIAEMVRSWWPLLRQSVWPIRRYSRPQPKRPGFRAVFPRRADRRRRRLAGTAPDFAQRLCRHDRPVRLVRINPRRDDSVRSGEKVRARWVGGPGNSQGRRLVSGPSTASLSCSGPRAPIDPKGDRCLRQGTGNDHLELDGHGSRYARGIPKAISTDRWRLAGHRAA